MVGHPFFYLSVEIECEHVGFRERTVFAGSQLPVIFALPKPVLRTSAILDMVRHTTLIVSALPCRIVVGRVVSFISLLDLRQIAPSILGVVQALFLNALRFRLVLAAAKTRASAPTKQSQTLSQRAIDGAGRLVCDLLAMGATKLHGASFVTLELPGSASAFA
jgi:hypothetical protein